MKRKILIKNLKVLVLDLSVMEEIMIFMFAEKIVRKYRDIRRLMNVWQEQF